MFLAGQAAATESLSSKQLVIISKAMHAAVPSLLKSYSLVSFPLCTVGYPSTEIAVPAGNVHTRMQG